MEEARQYSAVMKLHRIFFGPMALLFAFAMTSFGRAETYPIHLDLLGVKFDAFPDVESREEADSPDQSLYLKLVGPTTMSVHSEQEIVEAFLSACNQVTARKDEFFSGGNPPEEWSYVNFRFFSDDQSLLPYPLGTKILDAECTGTVSFTMPTLSEPFSKYEPNDEFFAVMHSWGLGKPSITNNTTTDGRFMTASYEHLSSFERDLGSVNPAALCIHTLANIESSGSFLGVTAQPESFEKIEIEIAQTNRKGLFFTQKILGRVSFPLKDGQCVFQ